MRAVRGARGCRDRGSATVWSVGAIAVLCAVCGALLGVGQAAVTRHRAAGGADLAALAAADHALEGRDAACALARRVALAQETRVVRCAVDGETSDLSVAAGTGLFAVEVRSRAGPAGSAVAPDTTNLRAPPSPPSPLSPWSSGSPL